MAADRFGTQYDRLYVAIVTPYDREGNVDEAALRKNLQYFMQPKFVDAGGGMIINPEAGEVFYLSREEKKRNVEIAVEECGGKVPIFAGVVDITTKGAIDVAVDVKAAGADGLFLVPPVGSQDITAFWDAENYPEYWTDIIKAQVEATDLPIITHPSCGASPFWGAGMPVGAALQICREIPNIVGWKMLYNYNAYRIVAQGLRSLDRHVAILGAGAHIFHESLATGYFDGTVSGFFNYAMEPMIDHINAWRNKDIDEARRIWHSGLFELQQYVASQMTRLHTKYKIATWLRGLIPNPFQRPPLPKPRKAEVETLKRLLIKTGLPVIDEAAIREVMGQLPR